MHMVIHCRGALDEVPVPERERICVHDYRRAGAVRTVFFKPGAVALKAVRAVFHEYERVFRTVYLIKTEIGEKTRACGLCVEENVVYIMLRLIVHELCEHGVQKPLPLILAVNGEAQRSPAAAARSYEPVSVKHAADIVRPGFRAQPFGQKQPFPLRHSGPVPFPDLAYTVFQDNASPCRPPERWRAVLNIWPDLSDDVEDGAVTRFEHGDDLVLPLQIVRRADEGVCLFLRSHGLLLPDYAALLRR